MERISYQELPEALLQGMQQFQNSLNNSGLDFRMLALLRIRGSQINGCAYCLDMHSKEAKQAGESLLRIVSVSAWRDAPYYTAKEKAVLAFAERLTHMAPEEASEDIHEALTQHFSKEEIIQLTLAVVQINAWNRFVKSFGFEPGKYQVREKLAVN